MTTHRGWKLRAKIRPEQEKKKLEGQYVCDAACQVDLHVNTTLSFLAFID